MENEIREYKTPLDVKACLSMGNYHHHIKPKHTEMTIRMIKQILEDPDSIYKKSRRSKERYFERKISGKIHRVVTMTNKGKFEVITAYVLTKEIEFEVKKSIEIYNREVEKERSRIEEETYNLDYYYAMFGVTS